MRCREDDSKWPQKNKDGRQELEIRLGNEHISFEVRFVDPPALTACPFLTFCVFVDRQNWLFGGRDRVRGPGRSPGVLLSCARLEGLDLFAYFAPFQGNECRDLLVTHVLANCTLLFLL